MSKDRVLSGMRPTGFMHLGHYHGALKNWVSLQSQHECFYFVADWHALTSHYDDPRVIEQSTFDMVTDWLAAGLDPNQCTIFLQSQVPQHAEITVLLGMITPLGWLERVPTYKEQQENLKEKDLTTYGFLGYPLMQAADIVVYRAQHVPVGEDQVSHLEITREIARRFNHIYGREPGFEEKAAAAVKKLGGKLGIDAAGQFHDQAPVVRVGADHVDGPPRVRREGQGRRQRALGPDGLHIDPQQLQVVRPVVAERPAAVLQQVHHVKLRRDVRVQLRVVRGKSPRVVP